jgi:hypothetical protein
VLHLVLLNNNFLVQDLHRIHLLRVLLSHQENLSVNKLKKKGGKKTISLFQNFLFQSL